MILTALIVHICIALSSVVYTTYLYVTPSQAKFRTAFGLVGLTIASGTYLVASTHSPLLQSCLTGLVYLAVVSAGITASYFRFSSLRFSSQRIASQKSQNR